MSIGYLDVKVSATKLEKLKQDQDQAKPLEKFGRFKAWLHYANLKSWQSQGHHFHYLTEVSNNHKKIICTCGLFLETVEQPNSDQEVNEVGRILNEFKLDQIQNVKGHRSLTNFKTPVCALIVDFIWRENQGDYLWTAFCQECGEFLNEASHSNANSFTTRHNAKCLVK